MSEEVGKLLDLVESVDSAEADLAHRFGIEGPLRWGDPVHERITRRALDKAGLTDWNHADREPPVWEFIRGVIWNDDPEALLFDDSGDRTDRFGLGIAFARAFKKAEKEAHTTFHGPGAPLTARSHFGDLQFLHGMASRDGEAPETTRGHMLAWAEFAWAVYTRAVKPSDPLRSTLVAPLFVDRADGSVAALFGVRSVGDARRRAFGSLLHMVQDSYAGGHVEREEQRDGRRGRIVSFHSYANQDHALHAQDDDWRGGQTDDERLARVKGALDAIDACRHLATLAANDAPWADAEAYLRGQALAFADQTRPSGPGSDYGGE